MSNSKIKHISDIIGEWGKWQFHMCCFGFTMYALGALNNLGYAFHSFHNDFWCSDVPLDYPNKTHDMKCYQFKKPNESCKEWYYDRTQFERSIVTEFNLVCDQANFTWLTQTSYILSYLFSGLVLSQLQDRYGRRPIVWAALISEFVGTLGCALSLNITQYIISRFFVALGGSARIAFSVIIIESSGPKHRSEILIITLMGWIAGSVLLPGYAYLLRDYKQMQFWSLALMALLLFWFNLLTESPRWLLTIGHTDKAETILRKVLRINKRADDKLKEELNVLSKYLLGTKGNKECERKLSSIDLLKSPKLRKYTLILWFLSTINAFIYYGFSLNMSEFGTNFYLSFLLSSLLELPSNVVVALLLKVVGRKSTFIIFMLSTATASIGLVFADNTLAAVILVLIGKFSVMSSWVVLNLQEAELFPTTLRQTGKGTVSVISRIGVISAPLMRNLALQTDLAYVMSIYAFASFCSAILNSTLPETKGVEIPDTIYETENLGSKHKNTINSVL